MSGKRTSRAALVGALVDVYRQGAFPMADPDTDEIGFYSPDPRAVLPLEPPEALHVPRSVAKRIRSGWFELRSDTGFEHVIRQCAVPRRPGDETWINEMIVAWYTALHDAGRAHCIEAWRVHEGEERMVGGVYGVSIGAAFFAESMFSRPRPRLPGGSRDSFDGTDSSKVALVALVEHLRSCGYTLLDTQFQNPHIRRFGVIEVRRERFMRMLGDAVEREDRWRPFDPGCLARFSA